MKTLFLVALISIFCSPLAMAQDGTDLKGEWKGTQSCNCFEASLQKRDEAFKQRGPASLSVNANTTAASPPYWVWGLSVLTNSALHRIESLITSGTGEAMILSCGSLLPESLESGIGYLGIGEFDVVHGSKDTIDLKYFQGTASGGVICECSAHLEKTCAEPDWLVFGCDQQSNLINPNRCTE